MKITQLKRMEKDNETISILGCGWLGKQLAKHFIEMGYIVKGSVTSIEKMKVLRAENISPYSILLSENDFVINNFDFFRCDVLIISIPPRRVVHVEEIFPLQIGHLIPLILRHGIQKVIFISSTSVYPDQNQVAYEHDSFIPGTATGNAILNAEKMLKEQSGFETTILRFGGLIGPDRNPVGFYSKMAHPIANSPVNLVHIDDCIGIISAIIENGIWGEILNACCPEHPTKKEFFEKTDFLPDFKFPVFSEEPIPFKIVDSSKLIYLLNYHFKYKSPLEFLANLNNHS